MLLEAAFRVLKPLGARAGYRLAHGFPPRLQGLAASLLARPDRCPRATVRVLGQELPGPVGLAAGLNKDGNLTWLGDALCMGFTVVGSVLPYRYPGARKKILLRLTPESAVNRLGLPSRGVEYVVRALSLYKPRYTVVAGNIAGLRAGDYPLVARRLQGLLPWLEVNVSCPNTDAHGTFEEPGLAEEIARSAREAFGGPVLLKIPHTTDEELLESYAIAARRSGASGVVAGNTSKFWVRGVQAGLSGASIYHGTRKMVRALLDLLPSNMLVAGVGGVTRVERAIELLDMGAGLVEVLTVLLRLGPARAREIAVAGARWALRR